MQDFLDYVEAKRATMMPQFQLQKKKVTVLMDAEKADRLQEERDKFFQKARDLEDKLRTLTKILIRLLVSIKYLFRLGAVVGTYYWLGRTYALALLGFICLIALIQAGIDKIQKTLHPGYEISEWHI